MTPDVLFFDAAVKAYDHEAQRITFVLPDGSEQAFKAPGEWFKVGEIGCLSARDGDPVYGFVFRVYPDQRLRRVPERDIAPRSEAEQGAWAWRLDGIEDQEQPGAGQGWFYVRSGVIPGKDGCVVKDETTPLTLDVPAEFAELCQRKGLTPEQVLRGFIADLCELHNYVQQPREDGYSSNGSDERMMANDYFQRAYGMFDDR